VRKELAEVGLLSSLAGNDPAKSTSVDADRQGSRAKHSTSLIMNECCGSWGRGAESKIGHGNSTGLSWGREPVVMAAWRVPARVAI
jgi:hypothetical protein